MPEGEPLSTAQNPTAIREYTREELGAVDAATRAHMLGVDYEALVLTARRLRVMTIVVILLPLAIVFGVGLGLLISPTLTLPELLGPFLLGALGGLTGGIVAVVVPGLVAWTVIRRPPVVQQAVPVPIGALAAAATLWFVVQYDPDPIKLLGCVVGAALGGTFIQIEHLQVPMVLRSNGRGLQTIIRQYREWPPSHTLVGGHVRWIVASVAAACVALGATAVIFAGAPGSLLAVALFMAVCSTAAAILTVRGRPKTGTWISVGEAAVLLAAAIILG